MLHKRMRLCGVLLVWGLLFCCGSTFAAEDAVKVESWIDHAADGFAGGTGSENDPYLIATAEQLAYLAKTVNEGNFYEGTHFLLVADIDLAGKNWIPIGTQIERKTILDYEYPVDSTVGFGGNLNGGGKTIANATIPEGFLLGGLFGKIHKGNIQNLSVSNISVGSSYFAGGIAGRTYLATIKNCNLEGDIHAALYGGGLVGYSVTTTIITCKAKTTIEWSFDFDEKYYPPVSMGERARYTIHGDTHSPHDTPAAGGIVGNAYVGTFILNSFADVVTMEFWRADAVAGLYFDRPSLPLMGIMQDGTLFKSSPDHTAEERFRKMCNSYGFIDMKNECVKENHFTPIFNNNNLPERRRKNAA